MSLGVDIEFKKARALLACAILDGEARLGSRPQLVHTSPTSYERMRKASGNPTLKSIIDALRPLGLELKVVSRG